MCGQHRRSPQEPRQFHPREHPGRPRQRGDRHPAHARVPAGDPAGDHARAVDLQRQEGGHRGQRAGRDLRREGLARGLLPAPAGHHPAGRGQLHQPRHHQDAAAEGAGQGGAAGAGRGERPGRPAGRARAVHHQPERLGQGGPDRPPDRARVRGRAGDPGAVPPPQEQPPAGRRGRRRQDRDRRGPGVADHAGRRARGAVGVDGLCARHGRAAGRHQVPRRLRAAPEGGAQAAEGEPARDPVHRRDPHADRRGLGLGRHARRVEPAEAGAVVGPAEVHRRDHSSRRTTRCRGASRRSTSSSPRSSRRCRSCAA